MYYLVRKYLNLEIFLFLNVKFLSWVLKWIIEVVCIDLKLIGNVSKIKWYLYNYVDIL